MFGSKKEYQLDKLRVGFSFKYNSETWKIIEIGEYDWRADGSSIEYTITNKTNQKAYLEVEFAKGEYEIYFSEAVTIDDDALNDALYSNTIVYLAKEFELEESYKGSYKNQTTQTSWEHLESHIFYAKSKMLTIEKWEDGSLAAFYGVEVKKKEIKDIKEK